MARRLDEELDWTGAQGRPKKYPWNEWCDGSVWEVVKGVDYECQTDSLIAQAHTQAFRRGGKVRTRRTSSGLIFQVRYNEGEA